MKSCLLRTLSLFFAVRSAAAVKLQERTEYSWPSPQYDELEGILYDGTRTSYTRIPRGCTFSADRNFPAEWVRFVYHDMSTHNGDEGTGGLDGSIVFELERPENVGAGMQATINQLAGFASKYVSRADIYASALVFAVAACGGPVVPFRGGRIDAKEAGPAGVPQPQESLEVHTERFRLQGFSPSEMIALTACGHTIGGVRNPDFPEIVDPPTDGTQFEFKFFDKTSQNGTTSFDERVVTEFLDGTTANPLVVDKNATLNSDGRIFGSDGNVTMRSMASPDAFQSTCKTLLERMINTVPKEVTLSQIIEPLDFKVSRYSLGVQDNEMILGLNFRVASPKINANRKVSISWLDTLGNAHGPVTSTSFFSTAETFLAAQLGKLMSQYTFSVTLNQTESISSFWFTVDEGNGDAPVDHKNGGDGYKVPQDEVLLVPGESTRVLSDSGVNGYNIVVATKGAADEISLVSFDVCDLPTRNPTYLSQSETVTLKPIAGRQPTPAGYTFYQGYASECSFMAFDIHAKFGSREVINDHITPSLWVTKDTA